MSVAFIGPCPPDNGAWGFEIPFTFLNWTPVGGSTDVAYITPILAAGTWDVDLVYVSPASYRIQRATGTSLWIYGNLASPFEQYQVLGLTEENRIGIARDPGVDPLFATARIRTMSAPYNVGSSGNAGDPCDCANQFTHPARLTFNVRNQVNTFTTADWTFLGVPEYTDYRLVGRRRS